MKSDEELMDFVTENPDAVFASGGTWRYWDRKSFRWLPENGLPPRQAIDAAIKAEKAGRVR